MQIFLQKNPWAKVVLIFGSLHNFCDNIDSIFLDKKPVQEIISFPGLAEEYIKLSGR